MGSATTAKNPAKHLPFTECLEPTRSEIVLVENQSEMDGILKQHKIKPQHNMNVDGSSKRSQALAQKFSACFLLSLSSKENPSSKCPFHVGLEGEAEIN